jgi:hypothetical protein
MALGGPTMGRRYMEIGGSGFEHCRLRGFDGTIHACGGEHEIVGRSSLLGAHGRTSFCRNVAHL